MDAISTHEFLEQLAAKTPTPAGGAAAAYAGAMAAALVIMVARTTLDKKGYEDVQAQMTQIIAQAEPLRERLEAAVQQDSAAFEAMLAARRLPEGKARDAAVQKTALEGARIPTATADDCVEVMALAVEALKYGNRNAGNDAVAALTLAGTSANIAIANAYENLQRAGTGRAAKMVIDKVARVNARMILVMGDGDEFLSELEEQASQDDEG